MFGPSTGSPRCFKSCEDGSGRSCVYYAQRVPTKKWKIIGIVVVSWFQLVAEGDRQETCIYALKKLLAFSPLSTRIASGKPRSSTTRSSTLKTRALGRLRSTSMAKHCRV